MKIIFETVNFLLTQEIEPSYQKHWFEKEFAPARLGEHIQRNCKPPKKIRAPNSMLDRKLRLANAYKSQVPDELTRDEFLQTVRRTALHVITERVQKSNSGL